MTQPISYCFPKTVRLLQRKQFFRVRFNHDRRVGGRIVVDIKENRLPYSRVGVTVTKKYGKAHLRNRFKRIVREAFRLKRNQLIVGYDLVIRPRSSAINATTQDIIEELVQLVGGECDNSTEMPRT